MSQDLGHKEQRVSLVFSRRRLIQAAGLGLLAACGNENGVTRIDGGGRDLSAANDAMPADGQTGLDAGASDLRVSVDGSSADAGLCTPTQSDVLGPFHLQGAPFRAALAQAAEPGRPIEIAGQVFTGDCRTPLSGAVLDIWQADAQGNYHDAQQNYRLRGQIKTDAQGRYSFSSIWPGRYPEAGSYRPAHIHMIVSMPAHAPLTTQMYFAGDPFLGQKDPCFPGCRSADPARIVTMTSQVQAGRTVETGTFDIVLQRG
ncbi:MAG: hypothetical protein H6707_06775 [Deltaproteobacteria bacterium]|nr:hypothetical protein [Deltaproteobacteria bacterium]